MTKAKSVSKEAGCTDPPVDSENEREKRERGMDQTLEGTYPASDPLSTIPNPEEVSEAA